MCILPFDTLLTWSSKHWHLRPAPTWPAVHATNAPTGSHRKEAFFPIREALIARDGAHVCLHRGAGEKETDVSENIVDARHNARWRSPHPVTYVTRREHVEDSWAHRETARSPVKPMMPLLMTAGRRGGGLVAFSKGVFFAAGGAVGCVGRLWWARTETVWGFGGRGWGREIGRPPLDNSAKLWVTPLLLGAACNITSNSSDKHQHKDKELHSLPILKPFTRGKVWPHCELADVYQYCVSDNSQDCRLGFW